MPNRCTEDFLLNLGRQKRQDLDWFQRKKEQTKNPALHLFLSLCPTTTSTETTISFSPLDCLNLGLLLVVGNKGGCGTRRSWRRMLRRELTFAFGILIRLNCLYFSKNELFFWEIIMIAADYKIIRGFVSYFQHKNKLFCWFFSKYNFSTLLLIRYICILYIAVIYISLFINDCFSWIDGMNLYGLQLHYKSSESNLYFTKALIILYFYYLFTEHKLVLV